MEAVRIGAMIGYRRMISTDMSQEHLLL